MRFGPLPAEKAEGAILAHGVRLDDGRLIRKGTRLTAELVRELAESGVAEVTAAVLEAGDVGEDEAAALVAGALAGPGTAAGPAAAGRSNVTAAHDGVFRPDAAVVEAVNRVDEGIQVATLPPDAVVRAGALVASVKVVPFGVPGDVLAAGLAAARPAACVHPFVRRKVTLVLTRGAGTRDASLRVAEDRISARVRRLGGTVQTLHAGHTEAEVAAALERAGSASLLLVYGAAATSDRGDVVPGGLERAGGVVLRLGIPVDPGNLLLLGELGGRPVVGVPGCARSPRPSGFDRVLARLMADLPIRAHEAARMGVGGLLREIGSRPSPRQAQPADGDVVGVVLAAGRSTRAGAVNKLLLDVEGEPLVRRTVRTAVQVFDDVVVVTGHDAEGVRAALEGLPVSLVHNEDYAEGMASSLACGVEAAGGRARGVMAVAVVLGDMPFVTAATCRALRERLDPAAGGEICVPVHRGRRGHPVLWAARFLPELAELSGDVGARTLLAAYADEVVEVDVDDPGVLRDVDNPADLEQT